MALRISRFLVVWEAALKDRYLQEFLPGGIPRWNDSQFRARLFATYSDADAAAKKAKKGLRRAGLNISSICVRSKEDIL